MKYPYWFEKPLKALEVKPEWIAQIQDYCETMGIPYSKPIWFLTSRYFQEKYDNYVDFVLLSLSWIL